MTTARKRPAPPPAEPRRRRVQSAEMGMSILKALARLGGAASLTAVAQAVDESTAKVHRYMASLVEEGLVDMLLFSINPAFDMMPGTGDIMQMTGENATSLVARTDPKRAELYRLCQSRGVGITVMKTFGAGKLLSAEHSPFVKTLTPGQCIHYALTRPAVASVLIGCQSREEVEAATAYLHLDDAARD